MESRSVKHLVYLVALMWNLSFPADSVELLQSPGMPSSWTDLEKSSMNNAERQMENIMNQLIGLMCIFKMSMYNIQAKSIPYSVNK